MSQCSSVDENIDVNDEREPLDNRGDADGSSLSSESNKIVDINSEDKQPFEEAKLKEECIENQENENNCSCKSRTDTRPYEENGSVLLGAWNELRSSLRQLHRSVIPSSLTKPGVSNPRNRPSINRIKALSNMLLSHDPHQLFTRVNQLSQELCIELKVRLLATIHDSPDVDEALTFIKGLCESYEWVINVCETIQTAFEKLDTDHLSHFGLNWMTVNMHTFHATIFTDPDVQDYLSLCCSKAEDKEEAKDILGCLSSLKRTLSVSENVWAKAENHLQEYAMERAAFNAQRRQLFSGWSQLKARQPVFNKFNSQNYPLSSHSTVESMESASMKNSVAQDNQSPQCPCTDCHKPECHGPQSPSPANASSDAMKDVPKSCECHFCNSFITQPHTNSNVLPSSGVGVLPPLSQPQLSLYPHIHGTTANGEITTNQNFEELGPLPSSSAKPPIFNNPYLGSDLLTEQLIREWDLAYGDALTPPGTQPLTSINSTISIDDTNELSNQLENLSVNSTLPYSHTNSDSHSCVHLHQEKLASSSLPISNTASCAKPPGVESSQCQEGLKVMSQEQGLPCSSVITHTKNCNTTIAPHSAKESVPSDSDLSDADDWSSGDESDGFSTSSSTNHKDSHCDCCYCHMLQSKTGGGRQKYSDRRERLLKILSHKKRTSATSTTSSVPNTCTSLSSSNSLNHSNDSQIGQQTLDEIMNYIEGKRSSSSCHKKAAKKARQKERKLAMKRQEEKRNCDRSDDDDDNEDYFHDLSEDNEEEEDGPLAELRRRAPDVTITVVKPGQKTLTQRSQKQQIGMSRDMNNAKHPLAAKPLPQQTPPSNSMWNPPRATLPSGRLSSMPMSEGANGQLGPKDNVGGLSSGTTSTGGLSSLLKGMESLSKEQSDKDGKSSQMVTIRRVMDPISSEPTVTITLKGEEPKKDKVLFKLVNGQACTGGANTSSGQPKKQAKPQEHPVYNIPEGTSPEDAKRMKKKIKKERQKQRKEQEKLEEHQREQMKQLEIEKRKVFLKQQEAQIRKQQAALERQQQELLRQQARGSEGQNKKKGKKGKTSDKFKENISKGRNISALVYDADDVAKNFSLPPGVSINKVAGQPGMVTISNNMGNQFAQPFLPNPNLYQNSLLTGYPMGSHVGSSGYPMGPGGSMGYSGMYNGCGGPLPWSAGIDPCTGNQQESVIVVDTNSGTSARTSQGFYKRPDDMTSEEKIQAAVRGEIDVGALNQTQKRKYKKCLKELKEEEEKIEVTKPVAKKQIGQLNKNQIKKNTKSNDSGKKLQINKNSKSYLSMSSEDKIQAAVRGELEISLLNQTQKKKYKKCLKSIKQEEETALQKQREEDELMDRMYEIARGRIPKSQIVTHTMNNSKKVSKLSREIKPTSSHSISSHLVANAKQSQNTKADRISNKKTKVQTNSSVNVINSNNNPSSTKSFASNNSKKPNDKPSVKNDAKGQESKVQSKQQSQQIQTKTQQKQTASKQEKQQQTQVTKKQPDTSASQNQQQKQGKKITKETPQVVIQKSQSAKDQILSQRRAKTKTQPAQNYQQQQHHHQTKNQTTHTAPQDHHHQKTQIISSNANAGGKSARHQSNFRNNPKSCDSSSYPQQFSYGASGYGQSVGYANSDYGHEARYAQYLAANASTLASVEYETNNLNSQRLSESEDNTKKGKKRGKRGQIEDLTTIDSVFTPKELATGELDDETDREVEAFKRFCLYNVPRNTGQKPKVNFNVKDIMIKKKH